MRTEELNFLIDFLKKFFTLSNFEGIEIEAKENSSGIINVNISTPPDKIVSGLLIGKNGAYLDVFSYLLSLIFQKKFPESNKKIIFDVNNYRLIYEEKLRNLALEVAKKVAILKKPVELPPMKAKDRRIIHLTLSLVPDIKTESIGEGKERHVVIKPFEV